MEERSKVFLNRRSIIRIQSTSGSENDYKFQRLNLELNKYNLNLIHTDPKLNFLINSWKFQD